MYLVRPADVKTVLGFLYTPSTYTHAANCCAFKMLSSKQFFFVGGTLLARSRASYRAMGRVRKVNGEELMTEDEFAAWRNAPHLGAFNEVLRHHLAEKLRVKNFRTLALVCGDQMLGLESPWVDAELVVLIRPYLHCTDEDSTWELLQAARIGDAARVVDLLEMPVDPDASLEHRTALLAAASYGHQQVAQLLLEAGADKDKPHNGNGERTPMHCAALGGHREVVHCLLEAGADKDKPDINGRTPLYCAADFGRQQVVQCLLESGADKDKADINGRTSLHCAAAFGHEQVVQCLLEAGADKDKADNDGMTPLHLAARFGQQEVAHRLLKVGANKDKPDSGGSTPTHCAPHAK